MGSGAIIELLRDWENGWTIAAKPLKRGVVGSQLSSRSTADCELTTDSDSAMLRNIIACTAPFLHNLDQLSVGVCVPGAKLYNIQSLDALI